MRSPDDKLRQRLAEAEQRLAHVERILETRAERPAVGGFPRDRWLGETVAVDGVYPGANSNTFAVKLLSGRFSPEIPGQSSVLTRDRGTIKICRTWPTRYYPEGSRVVVDHIRGVGNGGEWWISAPPRLEYAYMRGGNQGVLSASSVNSGGAINLSNSTSWTRELLWPSATTDGTAAGTVATVEGGRVNLTSAGIYHVSAHCAYWIKPVVSSGGAYYPENWSIALGVGELNNTYDLVRGASSGTIGGPHEHYVTVVASGVTRLGLGIVNLNSAGAHNIAPGNLWAYSWSLFLLRIEDA